MRRPTPFRTGPTTKGLGGGGAMSQSPFPRGEHSLVQCQLCPCGLLRGAGEAKSRKQDNFAERQKRPSGRREEAPGYLWWVPQPRHPPSPLSPSPHPSHGAAALSPTGGLACGHPPPPAAPARAQEGWARRWHLFHCALSKPVAAALFSSSVVFCSCTEVLAANSGSLPRSMITISISRSKYRDGDEPGGLHSPRFTDTLSQRQRPSRPLPKRPARARQQ